MKKHIAILASGNGSNAQCIMDHFRDSEIAEVSLILSNKADAFVLERARSAGVPSMFLPASDLRSGSVITGLMLQHHIDLVVLAGYLLLIPAELIAQYPERVLNIHPALLPAYGGKGMYGQRVHEAVIADSCKESGITIHLVNEVYDEGRILFQASCPVLPDDTPDRLAERIHHLEHEHYPRVIAEVISAL
jgi:phosphoribosylglycinamide formyltransferase-1